MIEMFQNRLHVTFFYLRSIVTQNKSDSSGTRVDCVIVLPTTPRILLYVAHTPSLCRRHLRGDR